MIITNIRKLLRILTQHEQSRAAWLCLVMTVIAIFEVMGVASIMPFIAVLSSPEMIQNNVYLRLAYDTLGFESDKKFLFALGLFVFIFLIGSLFLKAAGFWLQVRYTNYRLSSISSRLMEQYMRQSYHWFLTNHSANLATTILNEVSQVVHGSLFSFLLIVSNASVAVLLLCLLVSVDYVLAGSIFIFLGVSYGAIFLSTKNTIERRGISSRNANRARYKIVQEGFGGIKEVKVRGVEARYLESYRREAEQLARDNIVSKIVSDIPSFILQGLLFGGAMLVLIYLVETRSNPADVAPVFALYALAGYKLMPAIQAIYAQLSSIKFSQKSLDMLALDMERVAEHPIAPANLGSQLVPKNNSIKLEMVAFGYDRNNLSDLVLKNLSLDIKANTTVGFVGSSGSGKTTTVDLILGLLKPFEGRLSIGGVDLNKLERSQLAKIMGYVPQHIFLTDDSIATNIAFGVKPEDIDMDAVIRASEAANLHDFISDQLPEGYQTFVGERGVRLSGGQRQRIGIARALYQDPDILVLDEATSALDNATEQAVMDAVIRLKSKKTIILIAHRLSTIESCDRVFVFDGGEVVDEGSYAELEENSNAFRRLANVV